MNPKITRRDFLGVLATAAAATTTVAAPRAAAPAVAVKPRTTLRIAIQGEIKVLDPHITTLEYYYYTMKTSVFDRLVQVGKSAAEASPMLASKWTYTDDKTLVMDLRRGVKFHDGTDFTANDVKFTIDRVKTPQLGSQFAAYIRNINSVDVVDRHRIRINLAAPTPAILNFLYYIDIISEKSAGNIAKQPVGTGPFKFVEWVPNDHMRLVKNPHYWQSGAPAVDEVIIRPFSDAETRVTNLEAGQFDVMGGVSGKDVQRIQGNKNLQLVASPPEVTYATLQINTRDGATKDKRVRQAISYAMDRKSYVRDVLYGYGKETAGPFPPNHWAYDPVLDQTYQYNLEKAKALLSEAGYPGGKGLVLTILTEPDYLLVPAATILQSSLSELGVQVSIEQKESAAWIDAANAGQFSINMNTYGAASLDPGVPFGQNNLNPATNRSFYRDPTYADLVTKASSTNDRATRKQLYSQIQKMLADDVPVAVIAFYSDIWAASQKVKNFRIDPMDWVHWDQVSLG
jgi:peptide/nickel transport system substrate-binding protein